MKEKSEEAADESPDENSTEPVHIDALPRIRNAVRNSDLWELRGAELNAACLRLAGAKHGELAGTGHHLKRGKQGNRRNGSAEDRWRPISQSHSDGLHADSSQKAPIKRDCRLIGFQFGLAQHIQGEGRCLLLAGAGPAHVAVARHEKLLFWR